MKRAFIFIGAMLIAFPVLAEDAPQHVYSDGDLLRIAGDKYASGELPLGDRHYTLDAPRKGYIYLCHKFGDENGGGAQHVGPWVHGDTWNWKEKPAVQGQIDWPSAAFSETLQGNERIIEGNGLPLDHPTGIFPIRPSDPAAVYDRNPNSIQEQQVMETLPADPAYTDPPFCMGMEAGYMLTGVPLFNGFDAGLRDAAAHEIQDSCQGHPQHGGIYHYHSLSSCIRDVSEKTVIGYALDGFPITGPAVAPGKYLTTDDLDVCHGISSEVVEDGRKKITYHYVMTEDFPYSVSCFRAKPVRIGPAHAPQSRQTGGPQNGNGPRQPPEEAINACSGHNDGDSCGFTSPHGDMISGSCRMVPTGATACVPIPER